MKWLALMVVVVAGLCLTVWPGGMLAPKAHGDRLPPKESEQSSPQEAGRTIHGIGYVEPAKEIRRLVFKVDGVIESCLVELGQRVNGGDVLMSLADREEAAAVTVAEQDVAAAVAEREQVIAGAGQEIAAAKSNVELLEERLRHARKHAQRVGRLQKTKSLTEAEGDQAESEVTQAEAALRQATAELSGMLQRVRPVDRAVADAKVGQAEARLAAARAHFDETVLRAPSDGKVLEVLRREGEASRDAQGGPALIFADDSRLRVRAEIDERYVYLLREGQQAAVFGRALGDERYTGRIALVKRLMGGKTVFARSASERKDLDCLQVLIDMPEGFRPPLGLQVDVAVVVGG